MSSENREYNLPERGETNWDTLLNKNFKDIDIDIHELFETKLDSTTKGITNTREHVGPPHQGGYHEQTDSWGVAFEADANLPIVSMVVDMDANNATSDQAEIVLYESETTNAGDENQEQPVVPNGMTESEALVDSVTTTLMDGPQRVQLDFETPSNPATGEFFLGVEGAGIPFRRILDWTGWDDYTFDHINLMYSGRWNNTTNGDFSRNYYRAFDIEIGAEEMRVTPPWSRDVDEIYMRPRDPEEEFDDVSPRALWIDTSE